MVEMDSWNQNFVALVDQDTSIAGFHCIRHY